MRNVSGLALIVAAIALSGCVNSTIDSLSSLQNGCTTSTTSVSCGSPTTSGTPTTTPPTSPSGAPIVNTGNTANVPTGDTTIALESSVVITPPLGAPALSKLITSPLTISATADQMISFNTNTASNGLWPVPKTMKYNDYDTCVNNGGTGATPGTCFTGAGGTGLGGNYKAYRSYQPQTGFDEELQVWAWNNSYATQYRDVTASGTAPQHQAWSFGGNYTTAAAMPTAGTVGYVGQWTATATTAGFGPNTGSTTVNALSGVGTASIAQTVAPSNTWRVNGTSALTANFGTGTLNGRLTSTNWQGVNAANGFTNVDPIAGLAYNNACIVNGATICATGTAAQQAALQNWYNWHAAFMNTDVVLNGNITTSTTNTTKPNQVVGTADMDPNNGWITDTSANPMYAGFFGPVAGGKPQEVTGNFALRATTTAPNGGDSGINNDRRATIVMSGIFNGQ